MLHFFVFFVKAFAWDAFLQVTNQCVNISIMQLEYFRSVNGRLTVPKHASDELLKVIRDGNIDTSLRDITIQNVSDTALVSVIGVPSPVAAFP